MIIRKTMSSIMSATVSTFSEIVFCAHVFFCSTTSASQSVSESTAGFSSFSMIAVSFDDADCASYMVGVPH